MSIERRRINRFSGRAVRALPVAPVLTPDQQAEADMEKIIVGIRNMTIGLDSSRNPDLTIPPAVRTPAHAQVSITLNDQGGFHFGDAVTFSSASTTHPVRKAKGVNTNSSHNRGKAPTRSGRHAPSHVPPPLQDLSKIPARFNPPTLSSLPAELNSIIVSYLDAPSAVCLALTSRRHYDRVLATCRVDTLREVCPIDVRAMIPKMLQAYNLFYCRRVTTDAGEELVWELENKLEVYPIFGMFLFLALQRYESWYDYPNFSRDALDWRSVNRPAGRALDAWFSNHFSSQLYWTSTVMPLSVRHQLHRLALRPRTPSAEWELLRRRLSCSAILDKYQYCEIHCRWFTYGRPCTDYDIVLACLGIVRAEPEVS
ncbi:hypothetical protein PV08_03610 [Exophiala spinifera]|uniref:F-box domain-containing protein n=1 Tax=Exophiala spinifera TaxID=91928 RepID=A0A0D1YVJ4_9EURO|nr:uncharacterized protein PV08_03610 [Exophiala spinifera]KIW19316.1 hypothetical protein PV08_03610 [Exophiala spinifera]